LSKRKITITTGTRAEYGILRPILKKITKEKKLQLFLIVTGMHLSRKHGMTVNEIKKDGLKIYKKIDFFSKKNTSFDGAKLIGNGIINFAKVFEKIKPDINIILGDRPEIFASAIAAYNMNIPNVHIHGGDVSGNIDEYTRHAITKISNIHFTATQKSKNRIIRMGENPKFVFLVGSPSIDEVKYGQITSKKDFERRYKMNLSKQHIILLYHPVTTQIINTKKNIQSILNAVASFRLPTIIILPNSDSGSDIINHEMKKFEKKHNFTKLFSSIPRNDFLCLMNGSGVLVGNSSSGIIEGSFLGTSVVNIGIRQNGREQSSNVINVKKESEHLIKKAITIALKKKQKKSFLYGNGSSSQKITRRLEKIKLNNELMEKKLMY
jgi:UDP-N-acetylglucosamine 2-epimerase (non-hydrolysing)/GDP/UDP-N,N'-diacetylbacillosamine 2-epimerase (hydrolysing)